MQLGGQRSSSNVEDRRGIGVGGGVGIGTIVIALVAMFLGVDPSIVLDTASQMQTAPQQGAPRDPNAPKDEGQVFVEKVLGSTEDVWKQLMRGQNYREPGLVLFSGAVRSACGMGQSAMGPFYCPTDQKVYIDLSFYDTLKNRLGAPGDFAEAYVIAHEVGHHVQQELGISERVEQARARGSQAEGNAMSVRLELQADCFAGVWAHHAQKARNVLEQGDIEEAMNAAQKIGDDALQKASGRAVVPDSFTHGSSAQRQKWFSTGLQTGSVKACDTFSTRAL